MICGDLPAVVDASLCICHAGRRTWCAACLTVYDDYETPVNPISEYTKVH